ncbi:hypothetical protein LDJ78_10025, partial [Citrobacter portucalensis]|uniref:hypothetical protein n=1 Tax=Citrobacter portucalensis TaxID=1639133 RepID=UPI001CD94440
RCATLIGPTVNSETCRPDKAFTARCTTLIGPTVNSETCRPDKAFTPHPAMCPMHDVYRVYSKQRNL